jgi:hypothetical protein
MSDNITYTVHGTGSKLDGKTFSGGYIIDNLAAAGGECVHFGTQVVDGKSGLVIIKTAGKPDLKKIVEEVRAAKRAENEAARKINFELQYGKFIEEAKATGKDVVVKTWTECRRVKEEGEWGEYMFIITEYVTPAGKVRQEKINTY